MPHPPGVLRAHRQRLSTWAAAVGLLLITTVGLAGTPSPAAHAAGATIVRLAGADRYATAAAVAAATFGPGVPVAFLATGQNFPDALAGAAAAAHAGGPVLLVPPTGIPAEVATELRRLAPRRIVLLGGPAVLPEQIRTQAQQLTTGPVTRVAGTDRYATAVAVAEDFFSGPVPAVYLATGASFADALAASASAGAAGDPVLLVPGNTLPAAVSAAITALEPRQIIIMGGPGAVSPGVEHALDRMSTMVTRIAGADRYGTATALAEQLYPSATQVFLATGTSFPDALAGGVAAALAKAPLLLVPPSCLPDPAATEIGLLSPSQIVILGGTGAVPAVVASLTPCAAPAWLVALNAYRGQYGAGPVTQSATLSGDDAAHVYYMAGSGDFSHVENPASPYWTGIGARGGIESNLAVGAGVGVAAIDAWMTAPFHALAMLDPAVAYVGYDAQAPYAALGLGLGTGAPSVTWPLVWPSSTAPVRLLGYPGGEWPNPLSACPTSWTTRPVGLPLLVSYGPNATPITTASATLTSGSVSLPVCVVDETSYTNPDPATQADARSLLAQNHSVVTIPLAPLAPGRTYRLSVTANGTTASSTFSTSS
ncbi:MAG: cell wall-binding repeat-containing protein [Actinomycetes bacterium]